MKRLAKLTPFALVTAVVAVLSIGGTSYASHLIGSRDIQDNSIRSVDIKDGAVHGNDLSNGLMATINDVRNGDTALEAFTKVRAEDQARTWAAHSGLSTVIASCPQNQVAISGGFAAGGHTQVTESQPFLAVVGGGVDEPPSDETTSPSSGFLPSGWVVRGYNDGDTDQVVRAWVVCEHTPSRW